MSRKQYPALDETVCTRVLENGLTVKVVPRPGFARKLAYFVTDFGSIHQDFELDGKQYHAPAGIAHFLEHRMFELPGRDVMEEFAALGANVNAFTGYDMTAYYFSCTENFDENLRLLLEFVSTPCFDQESVEREIGIIDQEIGMNADAPESQVFEELMRILYRVHPIRVPILGTSESIRQINAQWLELCHRAFYTPRNMLLCVVGDVDIDAVAALAEKVLGTQCKESGKKLMEWDESLVAAKPLCRRTMEVAMPTFQLAFKAEPIGTGDETMRMEIVGDLAAEMLFGESSSLYLKLYEQGLIDSSFGGGFETVDGCAMLTCGGDSEEPEKIHDEILKAAQEVAKTGVSEADFLRMKRSAMGRRIRDLDSFDSTCFRVCAYHFDGFEYFRFPSVYAAVTQAEVCAFLATVVREERAALSIIDPKEES
ncbi:MAG: insulinase family protein [Ruminococcaceae bacterium]|nr:insulinase family protein [Oscillospiraceae bacterium]